MKNRVKQFLKEHDLDELYFYAGVVVGVAVTSVIAYKVIDGKTVSYINTYHDRDRGGELVGTAAILKNGTTKDFFNKRPIAV